MTNKERFDRIFDAYLLLLEEYQAVKRIVIEQAKIISVLKDGGQQDQSTKEPKYED